MLRDKTPAYFYIYRPAPEIDTRWFVIQHERETFSLDMAEGNGWKYSHCNDLISATRADCVRRIREACPHCVIRDARTRRLYYGGLY